MTTPAQVSPLSIEDFDAIESAVMETSRGRWFLAEYARRNRNADTDAVLSKLERLERAIRRDRAVPDIDRIRLDLADMAEAISRTKQEIAQMKVETEHGGRFSDASQELDAIVSQTESATNEILLAAEAVQEAAWTLREAGVADDLCDNLDIQATEIYTACSFQDLTGQRTRKVVTVLRYLESRINAMIGIWGLGEEEIETGPASGPFDPADTRPDAHLLNGPQLHGRGIAQNDIDDLMGHDGAASAEIEAEVAAIEALPDVEPIVFADAPEAIEAQSVEPAEIETEADVFASDDTAADVFASADAERIEPPLFEEISDDAPEAVPTMTTVVVGNTLRTLAVEAVAAPDASPALAVVPVEDPIAALDAHQRLVTFG
jgi:chemotaxis protein CheZ